MHPENLKWLPVIPGLGGAGLEPGGRDRATPEGLQAGQAGLLADSDMARPGQAGPRPGTEPEGTRGGKVAGDTHDSASFGRRAQGVAGGVMNSPHQACTPLPKGRAGQEGGLPWLVPSPPRKRTSVPGLLRTEEKNSREKRKKISNEWGSPVLRQSLRRRNRDGNRPLTQCPQPSGLAPALPSPDPGAVLLGSGRWPSGCSPSDTGGPAFWCRAQGCLREQGQAKWDCALRPNSQGVLAPAHLGAKCRHVLPLRRLHPACL